MSDSKPGLIRGRIEEVRRLHEIAGVFSKHGLQAFTGFLGLGGPSAPDSSEGLEELKTNRKGVASRLRKVLEDLGPTYIKLGQILSTRPDILPPVFIQEFKKLQDKVSPLDFDKIRTTVEEELGDTIEKLFLDFQVEPIATASMAQVHRATLFDGTNVVVKVQRPDIGPQIRSDLALLYYLARIGEATVDEVGLYNPVAIIKEFEAAITQELNFLIEAQNTKLAAANVANNPHVLVPAVFDELTTRRVITQSFAEGKRVSELNLDTDRARKLAEHAMDAAFHQIFTDGFFHGDPHPGNLLVTDDDRVVFLDWGLVGRLSRAQQDQLIDLILAIVSSDSDSTTRLVLRMGVPEGRVNIRRLRRDIERIRDTYLSHHLEDIEITTLMEDIMDVAHEHRIRVNPEYALLTKSMATVEGILREVHPDMDIVGTLTPYAKGLIKTRYDGQRLVKAGINSLMSVNHLLRDVPMQLDQVLMDMEGGALEFKVRNEGLEEHPNAMTILGSRIFMGFVCSGLIIGGSILIATSPYQPWGVPILVVLGAILYLVAFGFGFAALSWHFVTGGLNKLRLRPWLRFLRRK